MTSPESRPANLQVNRKMAAVGDREVGADPMGLQQGDPGLLGSDVVCRLLSSRFPPRLPNIATDVTHATWPHGSTGPAKCWRRRPSLRRHMFGTPGACGRCEQTPDVAIKIDTEAFPPDVPTVRGRVEITEVDGIPAEYASAARPGLGEEAAREYLAQIGHLDTRMARIDLRPAWTGVHDFRSRLSRALGDVS